MVIKRSVGGRAPRGHDRSSLRGGGGTSVLNTTSSHIEQGAQQGIYTERGGGTTVP